MFNKKRFRAAVALSGMTMEQVAKGIGINAATLTRKMNGTSEFTRSEIQNLVDMLHIDDPMSVFFAHNLT